MIVVKLLGMFTLKYCFHQNSVKLSFSPPTFSALVL